MLRNVTLILAVCRCEESPAAYRSSYSAPPSDIQLRHNAFQAAASGSFPEKYTSHQFSLDTRQVFCSCHQKSLKLCFVNALTLLGKHLCLLTMLLGVTSPQALYKSFTVICQKFCMVSK